MKSVNPPNPNDPIKPTFQTALATMVSAIDAEVAEIPKTDCEKAYALREALLRYIEQNCPSPL
jgi:hypothetical protein